MLTSSPAPSLCQRYRNATVQARTGRTRGRWELTSAWYSACPPPAACCQSATPPLLALPCCAAYIAPSSSLTWLRWTLAFSMAATSRFMIDVFIATLSSTLHAQARRSFTRNMRLPELRKAAKAARFSSIMSNIGSDFVREVSQAPTDICVVPFI